MSSPARFGRPPRVDDLPFLLAVTAAAAVGGLLLAISAYEFSPLVLPGAIIAVSFVVVTRCGRPGAWRVRWPPWPPSLSESPSPALSPAEGGLALVGAFWVARALIRPDTVAMPQVRDTPVIVLLAVIAIGLLTARDPYPSPAC